MSFDPYRRTYLGRTEGFWFDTMKAMEKHNVRNPQELRKRLETADAADKKKPDPMEGRVLVVDRKNPDRVLGSIPRPRGDSPKLDGGDRYRMVTMSRLSVYDFNPTAPIEASVSYVDFGFRAVNWTVVLTTDASLDLLVKIEDFRLPGEDAEQVHVRQMYAR